MKQRTMSRRRFLIFIFCLAVTWGVVRGIGSGWQDGLIGFGIIFGFWVVVSFSRGDWLAQLRPGDPQDERQGQIGIESLAVTGAVMGLFALIGGMVDASRGEVGPYGVMCAVGGGAFLLAQLVLPRLR